MPANPASRSSARRRSASGTPPPVVRTPALSVRSGSGGKPRIVTAVGAADFVDITDSFTAAVAHALWQLRGGLDIANWVDAERLVEGFLREGGSAPAVSPELVVPRRRVRTSG